MREEIMKLHRDVYRTAVKTILQSAFMIAAFVCFLPNEAQAVTFRVNTTSDAIVVDACFLPPSPGCSLRGAITAANSEGAGEDIIEFAIPASDPGCSAAGVCTINVTQGLPAISSSMRILGPGSDKLILRNQTGLPGYFLTFSNPSSTGYARLQELTIIGGSGGGIRINTDGSVEILACVIRNVNSSFNSVVSIVQGTTVVKFSLITGNTAGTIVHNNGGFLLTEQSTISGNNGRGIQNAGNGTAELTNLTISHNSGGGAENVSGSIFKLTSTIIAQNGNAASADVAGSFTSGGFNLIGKRDGSAGFNAPTDQTGTIAAPLDPKFDPSGLRNNGGFNNTLTLLSDSPAIDKGFAGNEARDQRGTGFPRVVDNPNVSNAVGGDGSDIGALERGKTAFDFDGDGRADIGIFRPASGEWWVNRSSSGATFVAPFGASTDKIAPGDFTGDGKADVAVFRPATGEWLILRSENFSFYSFPFGVSGDIPAPADYDGDWRADPAVFRPASGTWFILKSNGSGTIIAQFGAGGDNPVAADYDGDGKADIAIFRPGDGSWWYLRSSDNQFRVYRFGLGTDKPVPGDYSGDKKADIAVFRPSTGVWYVQRSENNSFYSVPFGASGDVPTPGDFDGDGRSDTAIFRPAGATWFVQRSSAGTLIQQFGSGGDLPVSSAFVP
jgi:hypothetical protein